MQKETVVVSISGQEADKRWSQCTISAESLRLAIEKGELTAFDISPSEEDPDFRPRKYVEVLVDLLDYYDNAELNDLNNLMKIKCESEIPQIIPKSFKEEA